MERRAVAGILLVGDTGKTQLLIIYVKTLLLQNNIGKEESYETESFKIPVYKQYSHFC